LLSHKNPACATSSLRKDYVNRATYDGNTALMWAAWSGSLETVQLLVRNRARVGGVANENGCTVAHWAASGGSLEVCKYLHSVTDIDFATPNRGGNTPLTHAVAFGQTDIVRWLRSDVVLSSGVDVGESGNDDDDDEAAHQLAKDFVRWTGGDEERKQILDMFCR